MRAVLTSKSKVGAVHNRHLVKPVSSNTALLLQLDGPLYADGDKASDQVNARVYALYLCDLSMVFKRETSNIVPVRY